MRDLLLQCSGVAAIAVALIHGVLGETKVFAARHHRAAAAADPDPAGLAGRHRGVDRRRRAAARGALGWRRSRRGTGSSLTLACRVRLRRARQCLGDARPAFRLDGAERGGGDGGRGILAHGTAT